jgi:hypothetical protein
MNRLLVALTAAVLALGCGGSDQIGANDAGGSDASAGSGGSSTGGGGSSTGGSATNDSGTPRSEAGFDLDAFPIPDGPIGACAVCIRDMCQDDLATCASDPKCQTGVICTLQNCAQYAMGEAGLDGLSCITKCFGDIQTALAAVNGLTCVTTKCDTCTALLDGGGSSPPDASSPPDSSGSSLPDGGGD